MLYSRSLEMIWAPLHGLVLDQMAAAHGDGDEAVVGMLDDRLFALRFAHAPDQPVALDLERLRAIEFGEVWVGEFAAHDVVDEGAVELEKSRGLTDSDMQ